MSHITELALRVRDLDALEAACDNLGLELQRDKRTFAWWGTFVSDSNAYGEMKPSEMGRCEHAIRVKGDAPRNGSAGPWEIGVARAKDGDGYKLFFDTYGSAGARLTAKVGPSANRLKQEYAAVKAERTALAKLSRHGYHATREALPSGAIRLRLRKR